MIDNKSLDILMKILETPYLKVNDFLEVENLSWRKFQISLDQMNFYLLESGFKGILIKDDSFVIDQCLLDDFKQDHFLMGHQFLFGEELRPKIIYLYIFCRQEEISNTHLQWLLEVSKNTAFADVKKLRQDCLDHGIELAYNRNKGYHLKGTELAKRSLAMKWIDELLTYPSGKILLRQLLERISDEESSKIPLETIKEEMNRLGCSVPLGRLKQILYFYRFFRLRRKKEISFSDREEGVLRASPLRLTPLILEKFSIHSDKEANYLKAQFLARADRVPGNEEVDGLDEVIYQFLSELEKSMAIQFDYKEKLLDLLKQHLIPAYYRLVFGIPITNALSEEIQKDYSFLMDKVSQSIGIFERWVGKPIPMSEVAFLTMILGGDLYRVRREERALHARVICPNGVSSSVLLKSQLEVLFPDFVWSISSVYEPNDLDQVDMIFSTTQLQADVPVYVTRPLLSEQEKKYIVDLVQEDFNEVDHSVPTVRHILNIVSRHTTIQDHSALERELAAYLGKFIDKNKGGDPMLADLLTESYIHFTDQEVDWKEAIALSIEPLEKSGKVDGHYKNRIIERVEELGAYIDLGKGIAIPHARPEDGVRQLGMSYLKLKKPIYLLNQEDHPVDTLIALAAIDNQTHLGALAELTGILSETESLEQLKKASTIEEVLAIIKED